MRMLVKKLPGLDASTYCWTPGMDDWRPVGHMTNFKALLEAEGAAWYYVDKDGAQQGPLDVRALAAKLEEGGELDGLSLVWHQDLAGGWKPLSEVEELRQVLRLLMRPEDEEGEDAGGGGGGDDDEQQQQQQVFEADDIPSLPGGKKAAGAAAAGGGEKAAKQSYVADDGTRYRLNPETNEWEEAGSGEESGEEDEEEDGDDDMDEDGRPSAHKASDAAAAAADTNDNAKRKRKKKKNRGGEGWDKASNKWIYVTGLPSDVTPEELEAHFKQVGILAVDPESQQPRVKLYRDASGAPKGDASIAYVRPESVELAIEILNGGLLRPGWPMAITKAVFQQKQQQPNAGGDGPVKRRKQNEAKVKVARAAAKQALSWSEADDTGLNRATALRIVVVKNMFHPRECRTAGFVEELQEDLAGECGALGPIEKMTIFERHPEGVVIIKFGTAYAAEGCVKLMNGRFFAGRKLQSFYWDGSTDYTKAVWREPQAAPAPAAEGEAAGEAAAPGSSTVTTLADDEEAEEERRLAEFGDELDNQELPPEFQLDVAPE